MQNTEIQIIKLRESKKGQKQQQQQQQTVVLSHN